MPPTLLGLLSEMSIFAINVRKVATAVIRKEPIYRPRFGVPDLGPDDELE